ncbi:membrane-associated protein, putative [Bodo saltans]|uniref:Membrane-associated protein, putative n=1 Tax=Bodo saltans TaxID=75058 RepID=A0A0S4IN20_BODSA|nr:membrane-associated protein, putative [Bodo saltans]|eukprot:CUF58468.1 membrane-associated protein, putative [Bodo saltans]
MQHARGGGFVQASYLFGAHPSHLSPVSNSGDVALAATRTRRSLVTVVVPSLIVWLAIGLLQMTAAADSSEPLLPGRYALMVSGMTLTLLSFRHMLDALASQSPSSSLLLPSSPITVAASSSSSTWWSAVCVTLSQKGRSFRGDKSNLVSQKGRSFRGDKSNLVLVLGATCAYVLTGISMFLEAGHTEWSSSSTGSGGSGAMSGPIVGNALGDTTGSEEETASIQVGNVNDGTVMVGLSSTPLCVSLVVLMVHAICVVMLTCRRLHLSMSPGYNGGLHHPRRGPVAPSLIVVAAAADRGALLGLLVALLSIIFTVGLGLPRADVMFGAISMVVGCSRAVRFVRPILWMLAGGDACHMSPDIATMLTLLERELMLLHGVLGIQRWNAEVLSCVDNGGPVARPSLVVLCASVRCQRAMAPRDISATTQEAGTRCRTLASSACGMTLHHCFIELSPDAESATSTNSLHRPNQELHNASALSAALSSCCHERHPEECHHHQHECHGHDHAHGGGHDHHHSHQHLVDSCRNTHTSAPPTSAPPIVSGLPPLHSHLRGLPAFPSSSQVHGSCMHEV